MQPTSPGAATAAAQVLTREGSVRRSLVVSLLLAALLLPACSWLLHETILMDDFELGSDAWVTVTVAGVFWLLGLLSLVSVVGQLMTLTLAEPQVSIAGGPLQAGRRARLHVHLPGPAQLSALSARLSCEVKIRREWRSQKTGAAKHGYRSTYPFEIAIPISGPSRLARGEVLDREVTFTVPADAESTRERDDRSVVWRIELVVDLPWRPNVHHAYPVVVTGRGKVRLQTDAEDESEDDEESLAGAGKTDPAKGAGRDLAARALALVGLVVLAAIWVRFRP